MDGTPVTVRKWFLHLCDPKLLAQNVTLCPPGPAWNVSAKMNRCGRFYAGEQTARLFRRKAVRMHVLDVAILHAPSV